MEVRHGTPPKQSQGSSSRLPVNVLFPFTSCLLARAWSGLWALEGVLKQVGKAPPRKPKDPGAAASCQASSRDGQASSTVPEGAGSSTLLEETKEG